MEIGRRFVVHSLSCSQHFATSWAAGLQASPSFTISQNLLKFMSVESMRPYNHLILCLCPLSLPSYFPTGSVPISGLFISGGQCIEASALASVLPMNIQGIMSFRIDKIDFCAVQGTLKNLLQHHNLKTSVLQCSVFFMIQLSHPHVTTGKTIVF